MQNINACGGQANDDCKDRRAGKPRQRWLGLFGYAVVYLVPYTFDLRPSLVLKELYVGPTLRGTGIGHALMAAVLACAQERGCARLKWDVLPGNTRAQAFYRSVGGAPDSAWESWIRVLA